MKFADLAASTGAELRPGAGYHVGFSSVSIDSRKVEEGALFVALPGATTDGHRFVEAALKAGAAGIMAARSRVKDPTLRIEETTTATRAVLVVVEDTLRGLQDAARGYLENFPNLCRVGITGSSGKTTTKEIAAAMVGREKRVVVNPGNLNSETGLPLAVFGVRREHEVGIFELGMNRRGEIAELARVLKPHIALITTIGSSHIGNIGSREAILYEKKMIFSGFTGAETALIPDDDEFRDELAAGVRGRICFYGRRSFTELGELRTLGLDGAEITWEGIPARLSLPGKHNVKNALAAAAIAKAISVGDEAIRGGLGSVKPLFGRSEILRGALTVIRDCYNANPESVEAAIEFCDSLDWPGRRVYVIGSMLELGDQSPAAHRELGRMLAASHADKIFFFGKETAAARNYIEENQAADRIPFFYTDAMDELSRELADYVLPGDLVLLKGSRGCALERLNDVLFFSDSGDTSAKGDF
jgi:UDP-N-acetylmuramoyl-tripeptide--D-alanyl-D-alanine ligase